MIKFIKMIVSGKKALVPEPMFSRDSESTAGLNPIRGHNVSASSAFTSTIPNRSVSTNIRNYTPPPKNRPFAVIPEGVCKGCGN